MIAPGNLCGAGARKTVGGLLDCAGLFEGWNMAVAGKGKGSGAPAGRKAAAPGAKGAAASERRVGEGRPARVRASRLSPVARKEQLLQCALQVFAERGLGEGRHTELAEVAEVAVPTTFHYFPTRELLLQAALDEVSRFLMEDIVKPHLDSGEAAPESIKKILLSFTDAIDRHPHHIRVWLEWSSSVRDGMWDLYLVFYKKAIKAIQRILKRGQRAGEFHAEVDTSDAARIIVGLAHMITQMRFAGNSRATVEHTVDSLLHGYLMRWPDSRP
jgi:TetR/AcrR family hemagglutinin/protease transcriptional regulator